MTNEEYREYVHKMYKENFLDKGKKPKWIQIFGDSFAHFISEGTWPYELAKLIGCPVISFAKAGANNIRTLSYFHQYYDPECLNIVLVTGSARLHINDEMYAMHSLEDLHGKYSFTLPNNLRNEMIDASVSYFKFLHTKKTQYIIENKLLQGIFKLKNTILIQCFPPPHDLYELNGEISEKFKDFYYCDFPYLLNIPLFTYQKIQFLQNNIKKNFILKDLTDKNIMDEIEELIPREKILFSKNIDYKNHLSMDTQKKLGKTIHEILLSNNFFVDLENINEPEQHENICLYGEKLWAFENDYKLEQIKNLNIKLNSFHEKYL